MNEALRILLSLSVSGSALLLATWGLSKLTQKRFNKAWHYYVWLIVILRLLLPFTFEENPMNDLFLAVPIGTQSATYGTVETPVPQEITQPIQQSGNADELKPSAEPFDINSFLQWLWLPWMGVAFLLLIRKITLYQSFTTYIKAGNTEVSSPEVLDRLASVCDELGIKKQISLYENPLVSSPLILGFFKPVIVLPSIKFSGSEFRHIMLHELTHYKRGDIFYKWLLQITLCLHWFNPLVYWMTRVINRACELSCDEAVIRHMDAASKKAYGDVLIESIKNPGNYKPALAGVTLSENAKTVKERLEAIMQYKKSKKTIVLMSLLVVAILAVCGIMMGAATPPPACGVVSLVGKSDAYKLIARLAKVRKNQSVEAYTQEITKICKDSRTDLFNVMTDANITEPSDPLYDFATGTLQYTSHEVFADLGINPDETPFMSESALWKRFASQDELDAQRGDLSDEEWAAFLKSTEHDVVYPVSMRCVYYVVTYELKDKKAITVDQRDQILNSIIIDMQSWMDARSENEVFDASFEASFTAELNRVLVQHSTDTMPLVGEVTMVEE